MACHEIAALRLGMMHLLGINDEKERQHELAELGDGADKPGPLKAMLAAPDFAALRRHYTSAIAELDEKVARTPAADDKLAYLRTLVVLTRKVELDLDAQAKAMERLYLDLETMHDLVHEIYPARDEA
jgi:hypothetical protein